MIFELFINTLLTYISLSSFLSPLEIKNGRGGRMSIPSRSGLETKER